MPLSAVTDGDVKTLYWFVNQAYLGQTSPQTPYLWHAKPGKYIIRVIDDHGRTNRRTVMVTKPDAS